MKIGKYFAKHVTSPNQITSSPASRAFYTALFVAEACGNLWEVFPIEIILEKCFP